MPVYEYTCESCGKTSEALRKMSDADAPRACESCGSAKTQRAHSVFAAATGSSDGQTSLPMGGCGKCGDPRGSCSMRG